MAPMSVTGVTGIALFDAVVEPSAGYRRLSVTVTAMNDPRVRTEPMPSRFSDTKIGPQPAFGSRLLPHWRQAWARLRAIRWFPQRPGEIATERQFRVRLTLVSVSKIWH